MKPKQLGGRRGPDWVSSVSSEAWASADNQLIKLTMFSVELRLGAEKSALETSLLPSFMRTMVADHARVPRRRCRAAVESRKARKYWRRDIVHIGELLG